MYLIVTSNIAIWCSTEVFANVTFLCSC